MSSARVVFLAGLPRSGTTLLANLLGQHSQLAVTPTSPLCPLFEKLRRAWSAEPTLLAQLDSEFDSTYDRLLRTTRALMSSWHETERPVVIDKHRGWLFCIETLRAVYPRLQVIVCVRDLRDVYGSIERQHRRTLLLRYADDIEQNLVDARAEQLFASTGVIGSCLEALRNLGDIPDPSAQIFLVRYERLCQAPEAVLRALHRWIEVVPEPLDVASVRQITSEADSYYRFKFPHAIQAAVRAVEPERGDLAPRVLAKIVDRYGWFYRTFYGGDEVDFGALRRDGLSPRCPPDECQEQDVRVAQSIQT